MGARKLVLATNTSANNVDSTCTRFVPLVPPESPILSMKNVNLNYTIIPLAKESECVMHVELMFMDLCTTAIVVTSISILVVQTSHKSLMMVNTIFTCVTSSQAHAIAVEGRDSVGRTGRSAKLITFICHV